jgi:NADPH:quinone reductase-like Zn-dependent oxidoreductase
VAIMKVFEVRGGFGLDALVPAERPKPRPGPGEVLVRVRAVSLNYRDLLVVKGAYNPRMPLPRVPCSDAAGEVVEVGEEVDLVRTGQRVAGLFMPAWQKGALTEAGARSALGGAVDGVLAEYVVLPEGGVVAFPEHLSDEEASTLPCAALTAWNALVTEGGVGPGDTVLVQGTGGVSLFALQFARLAGARVIATSSRDDKLERARELGAADGINYKSTPEWGDRARELTGGDGVDHVVEVGGAGTLPQSLRAVRLAGRISLIGVLSGGGGQVSLFPVLMKNVRIQGIFVGSGEMFEAMNRAIALHKLRPVIDRVFGFDQAVDAFRHLESGSHFGKVCIRVAAD